MASRQIANAQAVREVKQTLDGIKTGFPRAIEVVRFALRHPFDEELRFGSFNTPIFRLTDAARIATNQGLTAEDTVQFKEKVIKILKQSFRMGYPVDAPLVMDAFHFTKSDRGGLKRVALRALERRDYSQHTLWGPMPTVAMEMVNALDITPTEMPRKLRAALRV